MDASLKMITTARFVCVAFDIPIEVEEKIAMELKYLVYVPQVTRFCNSLLHTQILRFNPNPRNLRRIWNMDYLSDDEEIDYEDPHSDYPDEIEPHPAGGLWGAYRAEFALDGWWVEFVAMEMNSTELGNGIIYVPPTFGEFSAR